ncbi:hypothetical protein ANCDUO_26842 [Ancylostoma duodenale]|uniref:Ras-associating domain-containing protein n=1 Tax=Ancylostoma duodenale TaxID=51022 RepID=A0A0C2BHA1_9BILA|nr:hypothetical protein ANCDUO_26842 [Ancylostoma duodenale]
MELKVNVDGVERSISGVSHETTCAQIIYALAHAISQKGRFVMIEKFRNKERRLSPVDKPLELLEKWREHMSNVTFVLKKIDDENDNSSSLSTASSERFSFRLLIFEQSRHAPSTWRCFFLFYWPSIPQNFPRSLILFVEFHLKKR